MGNHKVEMAEIEDFSTDLQEASEDIQSQLDQVKESIESINDMSSFSGKTATEAKKYFEEMHLTIIESFRGLFGDLEGNLNKHIQDFQTDVDASEKAKIESNYLQDVQEDIKEVFEDLKTEDENIADILKEVSDITSAKPPEFSDVEKWKTKAVKKAKEMDEDLDTFTGIGDEHDVETVLSQIESVMEQAQTSKGSARFSDFKGASNMKDLEKLQGYNEDKQAEKMDQAKDDKESTLKDIQETSSQDVVNKAYQELEDGDITYDQYTSILKSAKNTSDQMDEATIKENADEAFIDYLKDRGMLEDYLKEHETVEEQEKINKMGEEEKGILNKIYEAYKNEELSDSDYQELRTSIINEGTEETTELLAEMLADNMDDTHNSETITGVLTKILNAGAAVTSGTLQKIVEEKGSEKIASAINQYIAKNTAHFRNMGAVTELANGGDSLAHLLPEVNSQMVRTGAKYLPSGIGAIFDFGSQVLIEGEEVGDAAVKAGGHAAISTTAGAVGLAIGGPAGGAVAFGATYLGTKGFDWVYDHSDDIKEGANELWKGTQNVVGDAVSGVSDGLGSIFG